MQFDLRKDNNVSTLHFDLTVDADFAGNFVTRCCFNLFNIVNIVNIDNKVSILHFPLFIL